MKPTEPVRGYQGGYMVGFLLIAVVALRVVLFYRSNLLVPILLLAIYCLLYASEPWLSSRIDSYRFVYFPLQAGVVIALSNLRPFLDFSSTLYIPLCIQALRAFPRSAAGKPRRAASAWLIVYVVLMGATLLLGMDWAGALALFLLAVAVAAFLISYDLLLSRMQADQAESERLLAALQSAHRQLQEVASQADELAAARERNRLARELHDSVSQVIFSIRLTSQSARILLDREPARVPEQVDRLQAMTGDALAQLRSLIAQLHPPTNS
jgi:signal transduction histidine kinase